MAAEPLAVAVRSPQQVVAAGIGALLEHHPDRFRLVPLPDGPDHQDPDVVLYDVLALAEHDTSELTHLVERTHAKVLAVGRDLRPDLVSRALDAGADGYFSLSVDETELVAAVAAAGTLPEQGERGSRLTADLGLTVRESEVLALVARGLANQAIADHLFLSINSVKTYIRSAYRKIGAMNRAQAVGWALRHGFPVEPPEDRSAP